MPNPEASESETFQSLMHYLYIIEPPIVSLMKALSPLLVSLIKPWKKALEGKP